MSDTNSDGKTKVLQAVNIVELVGQTVKLTRRGGRYVGLCPFHSEKTPSFSVNPTEQFFYCFGCKANGNVIDFVMKRDHLSFIEALQQLAQQVGVELPKYGSTSKQNISERQALLEANSAACGLFEKLFSHPQYGAAAREYLAKRGFNDESLKRFRVGLAIDGWDALLKSQAMKKFSPQMLALAGLVKQRPPEKGEGFYDTFRNRIIFPIRDEQGRIIAFGGRIMPGSEDPAKYLNSPETPLFSKSRCMYGLDLAKQKIVETKTVAVVEGYTDVVMAHQYGATNVVSVLGTAMTEQHVSLLKRFADRIVLLFDADEAGDLAVDRAVQLLISHEVEIAIASMPQGVDPDEFLLANGLEAFDQLLVNAPDVLSYKWRQLLRELGSKGDLTSQQKAVEQYLELLAGARGSAAVDPLRWGAILARVSRLTEIPIEELHRRFRMRRTRAAAKPATASPVSAATSGELSASPIEAPKPARPKDAEDRAQRGLLGVVLADPARWNAVQQLMQPRDFTEPSCQKLAELVWNHHRDEGELAFNELLGMLQENGLRELAIELLEEAQAMQNMDQMLNEAAAYLQQSRNRAEEKKLVAELKNKSDSPASDGNSKQDEIETLRKLQESARKPDIRRASR